jgi:hypothetical protein
MLLACVAELQHRDRLAQTNNLFPHPRGMVRKLTLQEWQNNVIELAQVPSRCRDKRTTR